MLFSIYYVNFPKVYEIKMTFSNFLNVGGSIEHDNSDQSSAELKASLGAKFLNLFNGEVGGSIGNLSTDSKKVIETFEVKTTKSIILSEVIDKSKNVDLSHDIKEGSLVKIDNVNLELFNEQELRYIKAFSSGALNNAKLHHDSGIDISSALNSLLKDYAYKIKGYQNNKKNKLIIKIPFTFENELENFYNIDDLFIGKVSIIGIYKRKIKIEKLKNSFEFFQEHGQNIQKNKEIHHSSNNDNNPPEIFGTIKDNNSYHYIDLLAIVQEIITE